MPSRCSVPRCTGNYTKDISENGSVSTFSFPKDPAMLELWKASIPSFSDKINTSRGRVCSRHFLPFQVREEGEKEWASSRIVSVCSQYTHTSVVFCSLILRVCLPPSLSLMLCAPLCLTNPNLFPTPPPRASLRSNSPSLYPGVRALSLTLTLSSSSLSSHW